MPLVKRKSPKPAIWEDIFFDNFSRGKCMPKSDPPTHPILLFKASPQMEQVLKSLICTLELERGKKRAQRSKSEEEDPKN